MADIHNYKTRLECFIRKLDTSTISSQNKKDIFGFKDFCFSEGIGHAKIYRYSWDLRKLAEMLGKDFQKCNKQDIQTVISKLEQTDYAPNTKRGFRIVLKKFYRYLRKIEDKGVYPEEVRWISTTNKNGHSKLPEELLNEEEVLKLINTASNSRDKAFISSLYESGCRIGEIALLQIKHIVFDEFGARINVTGKTGSRVVRLVTSAPYLQQWLNLHPYNSNPENYVWIQLNGTNGFLHYTALKELLKKIANNAGVKKKVNPHNFRHSRATHLAKYLTEAQLKQVLGWTQASKMASIYVHLSGRDTDEAILKTYGINIGKSNEETKFKAINCARCKTVNEPSNKFCKVCGLVLDKEEVEKILKADADRSQADEIMNKLVQDPEIMALIKKKLSV